MSAKREKLKLKAKALLSVNIADTYRYFEGFCTAGCPHGRKLTSKTQSWTTAALRADKQPLGQWKSELLVHGIHRKKSSWEIYVSKIRFLDLILSKPPY